MMSQPKKKSFPPVDPFPPAQPGRKKGPNDVHKPVFIRWMPEHKRPHNHDQDVLLLIGGSGSSKTTHSIAAVTDWVACVPGLKAVCGGKNYPLIERNVASEFGMRFSLNGQEFDHPIVKRFYRQKMVMQTWIGSKLTFLNLDKYLVARGFDADIVMIEEVNLMDASSFEEMVRRSRGNAAEIRQFIVSMNPSGERDWIYYKFNLKQFEPEYIKSGAPPLPIGKPCTCQFCQDCANERKEEVEWVGGVRKWVKDDDIVDSQDCPAEGYRNYHWSQAKCPKCGMTKMNKCPGNQYSYRVIRSRSYDNRHNPATYVADMRRGMSEEQARLFIEGEIVHSKTGKVYKSFGSHNELQDNVDINYEKDIIWTHDFNQDPMCSVLWQEGESGIHVFDEIIEWDANTEKVANTFIQKMKDYPGFNNKILIYGDPAGMYGAGRTESRRTDFQILKDNLIKAGFDAEIRVEKIVGETKIAIKDRVNNVNSLLKNADGEVRVKINPKCIGLINSFASVLWDKNGKEEDKKVDEDAKKVDDRHINVPIMTHPSCAFGYAAVKRFNMLMGEGAFQVIMTDEKTIVQDSAGQITESKPQATYFAKNEDPEVLDTEPKMFIPEINFKNEDTAERIKQIQEEAEAYERALIQKLRKKNGLA